MHFELSPDSMDYSLDIEHNYIQSFKKTSSIIKEILQNVEDFAQRRQ